MFSFTFDVIKRDAKQDYLYDIFRQTVIEKPIDNKYYNFVREDEECRLDKVMFRIYSSTRYLEEFMVLNNILNPWSIKAGDIIYFIPNLEILREVEKDDTLVDKVISKNKKTTRIDPNRQKGVPPTIKPVDFQQILVDKKNKTIKLNTKLS